MTLLLGNCLDKIKEIIDLSVDLVYIDPPFFTQKTHSLKTRDNKKEYFFDDTWNSLEDYLHFMRGCLFECKRILKDTGSIFLHCDKSASHYLRVLLDETFGYENFQSEIIWSYKRWSNSKKGLLNSHQTIYFYSKSKNFKFNMIYTDYSPTTNIDQILQERVRDENGKSVYKRDRTGNIVIGKEKKGVPLSDVWEIPYLNPKANERVGYPTQKPILLLEQIIKIVTDENETVLDPFCGSGTTLVAAKLLNRHFIGIDISEEAINLTKGRLEKPIMSKSFLLEKGKQEYIGKTKAELDILESIDAVPVQRNKGIDGFLKQYHNGMPVSVRIQKENESLNESKRKLITASRTKKCGLMILFRTNKIEEQLFSEIEEPDLIIIDCYDLILRSLIDDKKYDDKVCSDYQGVM